MAKTIYKMENGKRVKLVGEELEEYKARCIEGDQSVRNGLIKIIKEEAESRIIEVAPLFKQVNLSRLPDDNEEKVATFAAIDAIRAKSNAVETALNNLSIEELSGIVIKDFWEQVDAE